MAINWNTQDNTAPSSGGINWGSQSPTPTQAAPQKSLSDSIWDGLAGVGKVVNSVLPGQQIGESLVKAGTNIGNLATGGVQKFEQNLPENTVDVPRLAGDYGAAALTVASPELGGGTGGGLAGAAGRIGTNAAVGAGIGGTSALAAGKDLGGIAGATVAGGAVGGALSGASEGVGALVQNLPTWFTKAALPKLDSKNADYALNNTKLVGNAASYLKDSKQALDSYEGQVQGILSHPIYKETIGSSNSILNDAVRQFPNSEYTVDDLIKNARNIAPEVSGLLNKFEKGEANVAEINAIRKALDSSTKSVYTSLNRPPEAKMLGAALAGSMRDFVQTTAPETQPIFADYAKEIALSKALTSAAKQNQAKLNFKDVVAGLGGFQAAGLKGALGAIIAERVAGSTGANLLAAKGAQALGKTAPAANVLMQGIKAPIESAIGRQEDQTQ